MLKLKTPTDARLTHVIVVDSGQWARGDSVSQAAEAFKDMHSSRSLDKAQYWAVTPHMVVNDHGRFSAPRAEYVAPELLSN